MVIRRHIYTWNNTLIMSAFAYQLPYHRDGKFRSEREPAADKLFKGYFTEFLGHLKDFIIYIKSYKNQLV